MARREKDLDIELLKSRQSFARVGARDHASGPEGEDKKGLAMPLRTEAHFFSVRFNLYAATGSAVRQHPVVDEAGCGVAPHDVAHAIVVEVTDPHRDRAGGMSANIDAR